MAAATKASSSTRRSNGSRRLGVAIADDATEDVRYGQGTRNTPDPGSDAGDAGALAHGGQPGPVAGAVALGVDPSGLVHDLVDIGDVVEAEHVPDLVADHALDRGPPRRVAQVRVED